MHENCARNLVLIPYSERKKEMENTHTHKETYNHNKTLFLSKVPCPTAGERLLVVLQASMMLEISSLLLSPMSFGALAAKNRDEQTEPHWQRWNNKAA